MYRFQEYYIPERMMGGIQRWVEHACPAGDFLMAVFRNDLAAACGRADEENMANLPAYVAYLHNECPSGCWGSEEQVIAWTPEMAEKVAAIRATYQDTK